jgi:glycosyltransferase involved in cell wall biosynthesis
LLLIAPPSGVSPRATALADALAGSGHRIVTATPNRALTLTFPARRMPAAVLSVGAGRGELLAGYALGRRGTPWIADLDAAAATRAAAVRLDRRLVLAADALTTPDGAGGAAIYGRLNASAAIAPDSEPAAATGLVHALRAREQPGGGLRILMIGPVNSPHMEDLARALRDRGHTVQAGGAVWGGGLPPSVLPGDGIPVSPMTWPQLLWMRRTVRRFRPDVVHANWIDFAAAAVLAGARPLAAMAWGSDVYLAHGRGLLMVRLAARRADAVLADSAALLARLVALGAPRERTALVNWGVDQELFAPPSSAEAKRALRAELGLGDGPVIISARGIKPIYNPQVVLDAFACVRREHPEAQLVVKHQGGEEPELRALREADGVHAVGRVPYERIADYFRAADVCVSIPGTDSSPRSVWEAMACECACVLSDLPWVHELIRPGEHALAVPIEAGAVAGAIGRLLTDEALRQEIGRAGRALAQRERDRDTEMERLERLYYRLAGREPPAAETAASSAAASSPVSERRE